MTRLFLFCTLMFGMIPNVAFSQIANTCPNFNFPAPPGNTCATAPLLCGNYLEGYCSNNQDATADTNFDWNGNPCFSVENNVWLRVPPCGSSMSLEITSSNCQNGQGLETALFSGVCDTLTLTGTCFTLTPNQADTVTFDNLGSGGVYWLMIDGVQGDVCQFGIHVIDGIGTGAISGVSCDCTPGNINGPTALCPGQVAMYSINPPLCSLTVDSVIGGNGLACFPPAIACGESHDSTYIVWHIPDHMMFVGDSTGLTVTLAVDFAFVGQDTVYLDTIYAEVITVIKTDSTTIDSLAFCDCTGGPVCSSVIQPLPITIQYHIYQDPPLTITCANPVVFINGQPVSSPGYYIAAQDQCSTTFVSVLDNTAPPYYLSSENDNGDGTYTVTIMVFDFTTLVFGLPVVQNGLEFTSTPLPCGSNYVFTVVNFETGCATTGGGAFDCAACAPPVVNILAPNPVANCCSPALLSISSDQVPTQIQWQGPGGAIGNQPTAIAQQGGLYSVLVTVSGGCSAQASVVVQGDFVPPIVDAGANTTICSGQSATLNASSPNLNVQFQWNNGANTSSTQVSPSTNAIYTVTATNPANCCSQTDAVSVTVQSPQVQNLGVVGTISCVNPCFNYNGQTYCNPGIFQQTTNCVQSNFEIVFQKETVDLGNTATLTCTNPCYVYNGTTYCQPGTYIDEDACTKYKFTISQDTSKPVALNIFPECNPSNTAYTVSFQINGSAPFYINGAPIAGNYYTSPAIPSGNNYVYIVKSGPNGCETIVAGVHDCDFACVAQAGEMGIQILSGCEGQLVQAEYLGGETLGPDDIAQFVLYTALPLTPATILAINNSGQFGFLPGVMSLDQNYYISQIVGKNAGNGNVDLNDPCLDVSAGQTIVFHTPPPPLDITVKSPECAGTDLPQGAVLVLNPANGVQYALDGGNFMPESLISAIDIGMHHLIAQDVYGCQSSKDFEITAPAAAISLELGPDHFIAPGASITLEAVTSETPSGISWSTDKGETFTDSQNWTVQFDGSRLVTVNVTNTSGCITEDQVWVRYIAVDPLFQPNVFWPESVNGNEHFTVLCGEGYLQKVEALRIYDRWGGKVFERLNFPPNQRELGWDGTVDGKRLAADVFVYVMELELFNGEKRKVSGEVTLLR